VIGIEIPRDESCKDSVLHKAYFQGLWVAVHDGEGYEDDAGIQFSAFTGHVQVTQYALEPNSTGLVESAQALACRIGKRLYEDFHLENVVIREVQHLVATFSDHPRFGQIR
jgi:hypothetical protein